MNKTRNSTARRFIISTLFLLQLRLAYQFSNDKQPSRERTFCAQNSSESTLRTFWQEAGSHCYKEPEKLIEVYESQKLKFTAGKNEDKCSRLLRHQLRKTLIDSSAVILEDAIIGKSFNLENVELTVLSQQLAKFDARLLLTVWEYTIDAVYFYVNQTELAEMLHQYQSLPWKTAGLLHLYWKYEQYPDLNPIRLPQFTYFFTNIKAHEDFDQLPVEHQMGVEKILHKLPAMLRLLYDGQLAGSLGVLNKGYWEYLYAPRDNGPDLDRRIALTWIAEKNKTDDDGKFHFEDNSVAQVSLVSRYGYQVKQMFIDASDANVYFGTKSESDPSRWWRILWMSDSLVFQNVATDGILCASYEYDENRRHVALRRKEKLSNSCEWLITKLDN